MTMGPGHEPGQAALPQAGTPPVPWRKRQDKVRSAWIAFTGRIIAQLVGAVATVTFGVYVVHQGRVQQLEASGSGTVAVATPPAPAPDDRPSVVVLPFANLSGESAQAHLADGLTDALITELARSCNVRVISRTSSIAYGGAHKAVADIAGALNVGFVVEGTVVRSGDRVRVTTQVIDARHDTHVWGQTTDERAGDTIALHDAVMRSTAGGVLRAVLPALEASAGSVDCLTRPRS